MRGVCERSVREEYARGVYERSIRVECLSMPLTVLLRTPFTALDCRAYSEDVQAELGACYKPTLADR
jgi:hypothetical protein